MKTPATGSCQCGEVSYTLNAEPLFTYACHCHTCQKRTGSACAVALIVLTDSLQIEGELTAWERTSDNGETNTRYNCASCGNVIYGCGESTATLAKLQAGTLDDTREVEPEVHIWTRSRQPWLSFPSGARQYDTQPDDMTDLLHDAVTYRESRSA